MGVAASACAKARTCARRNASFGNSGGDGMGFIEPLDDRKRLGQHGAVVALQGGNQTLRVDRQIVGSALLAAAQMVAQLFRTKPLRFNAILTRQDALLRK